MLEFLISKITSCKLSKNRNLDSGIIFRRIELTFVLLEFLLVVLEFSSGVLDFLLAVLELLLVDFLILIPLRIISKYKSACIDGLKCKLVRQSKERRPVYI